MWTETNLKDENNFVLSAGTKLHRYHLSEVEPCTGSLNEFTSDIKASILILTL